MKKIINGRLYDTETAKLIGGWSNGFSSSDFHYCTEDIYQKKNGEYFLHGSGGAMSRYGKSYGGGMCGSQDIVPMTEKEIKIWAETHLTAEEYMKLYDVTE